VVVEAAGLSKTTQSKVEWSPVWNEAFYFPADGALGFPYGLSLPRAAPPPPCGHPVP